MFSKSDLIEKFENNTSKIIGILLEICVWVAILVILNTVGLSLLQNKTNPKGMAGVFSFLNNLGKSPKQKEEDEILKFILQVGYIILNVVIVLEIISLIKKLQNL